MSHSQIPPSTPSEAFPDPCAETAPLLSEAEHKSLFEHPSLTYAQLARKLGVSVSSFTNYRLKRSPLPYMVRYGLEKLALSVRQGAADIPADHFPPSYIGGLYVVDFDCTIGGYLRHMLGAASIIRHKNGYLIPMAIDIAVLNRFRQKILRGGFCRVFRVLSESDTVELLLPDWSPATISDLEHLRDTFDPYSAAIEEASASPTIETPEVAPLPPYLQAILDSTK